MVTVKFVPFVFAEQGGVVTRSFDGNVWPLPPMREAATDTHLLTAGGAHFIRGRCDGCGAEQSSQKQRGRSDGDRTDE